MEIYVVLSHFRGVDFICEFRLLDFDDIKMDLRLLTLGVISD